MLLKLMAEMNAVAFPHGTRFPGQANPYPVDARGFAAFELWRDDIASGAPIPEPHAPHSEGIVNDSRYNTVEVRELRKYAAAYCRELAGMFPEAATELAAAAAEYDGVVGAAAGLALHPGSDSPMNEARHRALLGEVAITPSLASGTPPD